MCGCSGGLIFHMQEHVAVWLKYIHRKDEVQAQTDKPGCLETILLA